MVSGIKVIELIRENVLKQAISLQNVQRIRQQEKQMSCNLTAKVDLEPLPADIRTVVQHAKYFLRTREEFQNVTRKFQHVLPVSYEHLNRDSVGTTKQILEFLGVDTDLELATQFVKTTPDRIADAIINYEELVDAVAGTKLEAFLD